MVSGAARLRARPGISGAEWMNGDRDSHIAVVCLALMRSGRLDALSVRGLLQTLAVPAAGGVDADHVLAAAGVTRPSVNASMASAQRDIDSGLEAGVVAIPWLSPRYPARLRWSDNAPPLLYARGWAESLAGAHAVPSNAAHTAAHTAAVTARSVAVVGTRRATPAGLTIAARIAACLANAGWTVVSGLQSGTDMAAHDGALAAGRPTLAVVGHGLDRSGPRALAALAQRIVEAGGALLSEHPWGTSPSPQLQRGVSQLQVALSLASVVVEGLRNGSAAGHAQECAQQRHPLFAVTPEGVKTHDSLPRWLVAERGANPVVSRADYPAMLDGLSMLSPTPAPGDNA